MVPIILLSAWSGKLIRMLHKWCFAAFKIFLLVSPRLPQPSVLPLVPAASFSPPQKASSPAASAPLLTPLVGPLEENATKNMKKQRESYTPMGAKNNIVYKSTRNTSFSFLRLSSRVRTIDRYCSTEALAFFSCSAISVFCSSALRSRPLISESSCSDWLGCWEATGTGECTKKERKKELPLNKKQILQKC